MVSYGTFGQNLINYLFNFYFRVVINTTNVRFLKNHNLLIVCFVFFPSPRSTPMTDASATDTPASAWTAPTSTARPGGCVGASTTPRDPTATSVSRSSTTRRGAERPHRTRTCVKVIARARLLVPLYTTPARTRGINIPLDLTFRFTKMVYDEFWIWKLVAELFLKTPHESRAPSKIILIVSAFGSQNHTLRASISETF